MNIAKIGEFISHLRKEKGLTQKQLAEKLFISDRAVSKWERGLSLPDIGIITELAKILDISVSELLAGEKIKNITINKSDIIVKESLISYKKKYAKNLFKRLLILFPILTILLILLTFTIGELSKGYVPFTNYQAEWNFPSFSQRHNRKVMQKFYAALKKYDYDKISKIITPRDKTTDEYLKGLKELKSLGVEFTTHQYWTNQFDKSGYSAQYLIQIEYKGMNSQLFINVTTEKNNKISISALTYQSVPLINDGEIWKQITDAITT